MKNMQLAGEEERWKRLCLAELGGVRKLRRKGRGRPDPNPGPDARPRPTSFQVDPKVREHVVGGAPLGGGKGASPPPQLLLPPESEGVSPDGSASAAAAATEGGEDVLGSRSREAIDGRKPAFPSGLLASHPPPPLRQDTCFKPGSVNGAESQAFPHQSLPSRIMVCQQQQPRPALESGFPSVSHVLYSSRHPDSPLSPRKRLGEPSGAPSEIKAIQQTRRLLANARERTRVHTISAAFEALRKQVPCYSYGQKLSKLAILRIACNYILSLARLADLDYSADHSNMSFSECVEQCTRTLQAEGRSKKRKE